MSQNIRVGKSKSKRKLFIAIGIVILFVVIGVIIFAIKNKSGEDKNKPSTSNQEVVVPIDTKVEVEEKALSKSKATEFFKYIPKIYTEAIAPFTDSFMLGAVMDKIMNETDNESEPDYSIENVDNIVKEIFGKDAKIDKAKVEEPDVENSIFYYSKEAGSYAVIPIGYEGVLKHQILKEVTETNKAYYIYAYCLIGGYSYDESNSLQNEFGEVNFDNLKVQVVVGDKNGNDLIHTFDNFQEIYNEDIWISKYANKMPVFRYTLTKSDEGYYLTEVEQINY